MESEQLAIFNEQMERIGIRSRAEVHAQGFWHQTFHCWLLQSVDNTDYLLFQRRAAQKKDFPNQLDITAAGHLLAHEVPGDGVREIHEELGLQIAYSDLVPAGIIKDQLIFDHFKDREFCHIYFYILTQAITNLVLQQEEVASIVQIKLTDIARLIQQQVSTIAGQEYRPDSAGSLSPQPCIVSLHDLCPHNLSSYYMKIIQSANLVAQTR